MPAQLDAVTQEPPSGTASGHSNPYPNTWLPGQPEECEPGNESQPPHYKRNVQVIGNLSGSQGAFTNPTRRNLP